MSTPIYKGYVARLDDVNPRERTVTAVITTDALDSFKEVVIPKGGDLKRYRKNPVVLWMHNRDSGEKLTPIGKNLWIKPTGNGRGLVASTQFTDDERGVGFLKLYEEEILRAWSIGFDEIDSGAPEPKEIKARPELADARRIYRKWILLEYSAVAIGANPEALTIAVNKGLWLPESVQAQAAKTEPDDDEPEPEPKLPAFVGRRFADVHAEAVAKVRAAGAGLIVEERDRLAGRV